jgi:hypothetical protein
MLLDPITTQIFNYAILYTCLVVFVLCSVALILLVFGRLRQTGKAGVAFIFSVFGAALIPVVFAIVNNYFPLNPGAGAVVAAEEIKDEIVFVYPHINKGDSKKKFAAFAATLAGSRFKVLPGEEAVGPYSANRIVFCKIEDQTPAKDLEKLLRANNWPNVETVDRTKTDKCMKNNVKSGQLEVYLKTG